MVERRAQTTLRQMRAVFQARGIRPKKGLGQNFLVDANLLGVIAAAAELTSRDIVLEVGSGTGSLTEVLAAKAGAVVGVEKDEYLGRLARESLAELSHVWLVAADVLDERGAISPPVHQALGLARTKVADARFKVVGDLPFSVATPVIQALMALAPQPELIAVIVQREVGERLAAKPGSKAYGYLTVLVQSLGEVELLRALPPWVYWPRPKVWSALVRIRPKGAAPVAALREVAAALFQQRRKTAANALLNKGLTATRQEAEEWLARAGIGPERRADALTVAEIIELAKERSRQLSVVSRKQVL